MTNQQKFEQAYAAFTPAPDDPVDNIPFYRAYAGLRSAWGESWHTKWGHVLHHIACCLMSRDVLESHKDDLYQVALKQLSFWDRPKRKGIK